MKKMEEMENRLNTKIDEIKHNQTYSIIAQSDKQPAKLKTTWHREAQKTEIKIDEEKLKEKNDRTLIIQKYSDPAARKKNAIRQVIRKEYPGVKIELARTTPGGSILVEFEDKDTAENVKKNWNKNLFGGNQGVLTKKTNPPAGIVKNVLTQNIEDEEMSDEEIISEIKATFPNAEIDLFKRDNRFTGTLKIQFNTEEELQRAIESRIIIFDQRCRIERYKYKPRVIVCGHCQTMSHVYRICESRLQGKPPRCGKCSATGHQTNECQASQKDYKCCLCEGNHQTGAKVCAVIKQTMDQLIERRQDGY